MRSTAPDSSPQDLRSTVVAVEGLVFAYGKHAPTIIDGLDHAFMPGAVTVVTGPSGRGKSTLLYVLGLMLTPTAGTVRWDGVDVSVLRDGDRSRLRAERVGFVFQDAVLDPSRSVLANVTEGGLYSGSPGRERRTRALDLMERFGVAQRATHKPGEVSGGQAQRVALCRALLNQPPLLLADEPSGNLDHDSANLVWAAFTAAAATGATVIVATHDLTRAATADAALQL